jgi:hypothetical protein
VPEGEGVGCNNTGDERLEVALENPPPLPSHLVNDSIKDLVDNRAGALPTGATEAEYLEMVAALTRNVIGDIGEKAIEKVLTNADHYILMQSDKHAARPEHRLPNDFVTLSPNGSMYVFDVKATASGKQLARANPDGSHNLPRPSLSTSKDGRQLNDSYNLVRMVEAVAFQDDPKHGEGPQAYVLKVDLTLMAYQVWEVDADGKVGDSIGPPLSVAVEIAEAIAALRDDDGLSGP